jgi:hypothetical protein
MQTRLRNHLTKYKIFSSEQHGFRKTLTTDKATYTLTNEILTAMSNKSKAGAIFCDTEEALDCVNHNVLLLKMECYGIIGK